MEKLTRDYYKLSDAAELLGCNVDELIHLGATGKLPIHVMPKEWWGMIFDQSYFQLRGDESVYNRTPERIMIRDLADGRLWPGTIQFFEDGDEEVTLKSCKLSPNSETGKFRQVDLDVPVVIKRSQLFVFAEEINKLKLEPSVPSKGEDGVSEVSKSPPNEKGPKGLGKHEIATAFNGIHWSYKQWLDNLPCNPKWLVGDGDKSGVRASPGKKGRGGETLWNPAKIAIKLYDQNEKFIPALNKAFRENESLAPWSEEWKAHASAVAWYSK